MNTATDLDLIGLKLRPLNSGMHRSGSARRRRLIHEGRALLAYILRANPSSALVRRYVRAVEKLRSGIPLALVSPLYRWPMLLALLDYRCARAAELAWRIDAATVIGEASTQGATRFLGGQQFAQLPIALLTMASAVSAELIARILRVALPTRFFIAAKHSDGDY